MSIIAALSLGGGTTWIGSDTIVCSDSVRHEIGPKWIARPPWAIGVAGHLRAANVLFRGAPDLLEDLADAFEFSLRVRACLQADGFRDGTAERGPLDLSQTVMLAHPSGIWSVGADLSVMPVPAGVFWAEGSGREIALGAGYALLRAAGAKAGQLDGREVLRHAIEAAMALDITCGGEAWTAELAEAAVAVQGDGRPPGAPAAAPE